MRAVAILGKRLIDTIYVFPRSLRYGFMIANLGVVVAWLLLPKDAFDKVPPVVEAGFLRNNFARRWGGGCNGWTTDVAIWHLAGQLATWYAYSIASFAILIGHPMSIKNKVLAAAITLTGLFIFTCGLTHLVSAYAMFNPVYVIDGASISLNGAVSLPGAVLICYALEKSRRIAASRARRLEELERDAMKRRRSP